MKSSKIRKVVVDVLQDIWKVTLKVDTLKKFVVRSSGIVNAIGTYRDEYKYINMYKRTKYLITFINL